MHPPLDTIDAHLELLQQGCSEVTPRAALAERLAAAAAHRRPLRVKLGCDPTAADLHLGHTVVLQKLAQFQALGHRAVFIIGDATAQIGDPTGRNQQRPALSAEAVAGYSATYLAQVAAVLDLAQTEVRRNSEWLAPLRLAEVVGLLSQYNLGRMLERRDFRARLDAGVQLAMHELIYPLLQGLDSVVVAADVELGGHDQIFNLHVGRHLMEARGQAPQVVMTCALLVGCDGREKMSKSSGNHIGIAEAPQQMFAKTLSISDDTMASWTLQLLGRPVRADDAPLAAKKQLAEDLVARFHGAAAAQAARAWWEAGRPLSAEAPPVKLAAGTTLQRAVMAAGAAASGQQARRKIEQGGVYIDDLRCCDPLVALAPGLHRLRVGKTMQCLLQVQGPER